MATRGQSSPPSTRDPVTSLTDCPHCGSLCLGPSILPCGHLLCRKCLHDVLQHGRAGCPKCQQPLRLPRDQDLSISQVIGQMGADPIMEHLVLQELEREGGIHCLNCPNKIAANVCLDCQDYYCEVCSANHTRSRSAKDHVLLMLHQALRNTSSTASTTPRPRSPSVLSTSSMDSIRNIDDRQSRGPSRAVSRKMEWVKKNMDELEQSLSKYEEMETTAQNIASLGQQLVNSVRAHRQLLLTYHQHLSRLEATLTPDPGSYHVKIRGCDVSVKMKTEFMERRLCDVRKEHHCHNMEEMERIVAQLTQLLQSADGELSPTHDDTLTSTPRLDVMTATPQRVSQSSPRTDQDSESPRIIAIVCLPDDRLVMTDCNNDKVKVMDVTPPHALSASTHIPERPLGLAVLPDGLVAMTTWKPVIYLMEVTSTVRVESRIHTNRRYQGIAGHSEELLIVSCGPSSKGPDAVHVMNRQGGLVRRLTDSSVALECPEYLCQSGDQHILLSDWELHVVHEIDVSSGQVTQTFRHTDMEGSLQVCVDSSGNVFVACYHTQCVMVRNREGQWRKLLTASLHSDPGITCPRAVCLTRSGHLVVAWGKPGIDSVVICYKLT